MSFICVVIYINIAICDDQKNFREFLKIHLKNYYEDKGICVQIHEFSCGEDLLQSNIFFDIAFLDVEMNGMNGIETGRKLKQQYSQTILFMITAYDGYLDDAFRIHAFRFLSKPLDVLRLYKALDYAFEQLNNEFVVFYDVSSGKDIKIITKDIILIEIEKKKTKVVTTNGIYYSKEKISFWKNKLNGISFVCPHSSYVANLDYSIQHSRTELVLAKKDNNGNIVNKYIIAIAPKKQSEIKQKFFYVLERR